MQKYGYVRISFDNCIEELNENIDKSDIFKSIVCLAKSKPLPKLFDHSFMIVNCPEGIYRYESYIGEYKPRKILWNNYKEDLISCAKLFSFDDLLSKWKDIFGVLCDENTKLNLSKIKIVINN